MDTSSDSFEESHRVMWDYPALTWAETYPLKPLRVSDLRRLVKTGWDVLPWTVLPARPLAKGARVTCA